MESNCGFVVYIEASSWGFAPDPKVYRFAANSMYEEGDILFSRCRPCRMALSWCSGCSSAEPYPPEQYPHCTPDVLVFQF